MLKYTGKINYFTMKKCVQEDYTGAGFRRFSLYIKKLTILHVVHLLVDCTSLCPFISHVFYLDSFPILPSHIHV